MILSEQFLFEEYRDTIPDKLKNKNKIICFPVLCDRHCWHNTNVYKFTRDKFSLKLRPLELWC